MRCLIYGAGTIGLTYGWLLSRENEVEFFVKPERYESLAGGIDIAVKDVRKQSTAGKKVRFHPKCVREAAGHYDVILIAVTRIQLQDVLPALSNLQRHTEQFGFLQNSWNLRAELENVLPENRYFVAFPSSVGGGRDENGLSVLLFDEATRLGGSGQRGIVLLEGCLNRAGVKTRRDKAIFDWLKVHYLQQSITAGAVLECGGFAPLAASYPAVKKMTQAFREGVRVCRLQGVRTHRIFPANLFELPLGLVARAMQKMLLEPNTAEMVKNHMKQGLPEWAAGYREVLRDGRASGLPMPVWGSYEAAVERYRPTK